MSTLGAAIAYRLRIGTLWERKRLLAILPKGVRRHRGVRLLKWVGARGDVIVDPAIDANLAVETPFSTLRANDQIAACHFGFLHQGTLGYYMPSYDAASRKDGAGTLLYELVANRTRKAAEAQLSPA